MVFLELRCDPGLCSRVTVRVALSNFVCLAMSGLLSSYNGHLRNLNYTWQYNTDASGGEQETEFHFLVGTLILGFLSIFKKSQASSPFEALNSMCLSRCQRDVILAVQMRWRPMVSLSLHRGFRYPFIL